MNIDILLLLFFLLGMLTAGGIMLIVKLKDKYNFTIAVWILIISGLLLLVFSIAWATSSVIEYENQAAGLGLLIFGGMSLILFSITAKIVKKKELTPQVE